MHSQIQLFSKFPFSFVFNVACLPTLKQITKNQTNFFLLIHPLLCFERLCCSTCTCSSSSFSIFFSNNSIHSTTICIMQYHQTFSSFCPLLFNLFLFSFFFTSFSLSSVLSCCCCLWLSVVFESRIKNKKQIQT